ncbi:hypothetical protein [Luteibaculum oceani]|uniref:Uncharacterized protein n=1 Tax=Luteibaculum oceani TaxID=1294296 RepID=A0A5C6V7Y4_9FLAO|nr:hypothetical protein [Luteibaculum oceani]TXC81383.1 hypothetical protein FRX97_05095 [Luteibaculum oceani]
MTKNLYLIIISIFLVMCKEGEVITPNNCNPCSIKSVLSANCGNSIDTIIDIDVDEWRHNSAYTQFNADEMEYYFSKPFYSICPMFQTKIKTSFEVMENNEKLNFSTGYEVGILGDNQVPSKECFWPDISIKDSLASNKEIRYRTLERNVKCKANVLSNFNGGPTGCYEEITVRLVIPKMSPDEASSYIRNNLKSTRLQITFARIET